MKIIKIEKLLNKTDLGLSGKNGTEIILGKELRPFFEEIAKNEIVSFIDLNKLTPIKLHKKIEASHKFTGKNLKSYFSGKNAREGDSLEIYIVNETKYYINVKHKSALYFKKNKNLDRYYSLSELKLDDYLKGTSKKTITVKKSNIELDVTVLFDKRIKLRNDSKHSTNHYKIENVDFDMFAIDLDLLELSEVKALQKVSIFEDINEDNLPKEIPFSLISSLINKTNVIDKLQTGQSDVHKIRPAGKHLLTVGRDLIQNKYAAIIELVKNAYDADATEVNVEFSVIPNPNEENDSILKITVTDNGHGMTRNTVINKWMVPSTDDKQSRQESPNGRVMQGRKGIGRYSASILGSDLLMETITEEGEYTTVYLEWTDFLTADYLDDVEILVDTIDRTNKSKGTILTITAIDNDFNAWDVDEAEKLEYELKKLVSPVENEVNKEFKNIDFTINIEYKNFWEEEVHNIRRAIKPFPIFDLYDYRVSGMVTKEGIGKLVYHNQKSADNTVESYDFYYIPEEFVNNKDKNEYYPTNCGELYLDIRVYDRDKESIEQLINRGLKDDNGKYVGKLEARRMLNANNGIGVYRNGFRLRPLGDPEYDWLQLNKQRIQNPTQKLGSDQVIGYVLIKPEEESGLEEKSARDGLNDNKAYRNLIEVTQNVISSIETRRYSFRKKMGLGKTALKIERELKKLFDYDTVKLDIRSTLEKGLVDKNTTDSVITIVEQKENENNVIADNIRNEVTKYQSQATLGKIIDVIKHESGAPLNFFKNNGELFRRWYKKYNKTQDFKYIEKILESSKGFELNSSLLTSLFDKITPLSATDRGEPKSFNLLNTINEAINIYTTEAEKNEINIEVKHNKEFIFTGYSVDFYQIFINLLSNSVYWLSRTSKEKKIISIEISSENNTLNYIDIRDSGPGIEKHILDSHSLFEPGFSTKTNGTGIGLAIAGEAALRNGLELIALESTDGAYFRLQEKEE